MARTVQEGLTFEDGALLVSGSGGAPATPGGSNKQVQFNDGGAFGGNAGLTYDKATRKLTLTNVAGTQSVPQFVDADGILNFQPLNGDGGLMTYQIGFNDVILESAAAFDLSYFFTNLSTADGASVNWVLKAGAAISSLQQFNAANSQQAGPGYSAAGAYTYLFAASGYLFLGQGTSSTGDPAVAIKNGTIAFVQSTTAPAIATAGTVTTNNTQVARIAPAAAVTGIILQAGISPGQKLTVINQSAAINTATMATAATSNVSNGVSCSIAGLTAKSFTWNAATSLWYPES